MAEKLITSVPGFSDSGYPKNDFSGDADIIIAQAEAAGEHLADRDSAVDSYVRTIMDLADKGEITGGKDGSRVYDRELLTRQLKQMATELNTGDVEHGDPLLLVPKALREAIDKLLLSEHTADTLLRSLQTDRWSKPTNPEVHLDLERLMGGMGDSAVQLVNMGEVASPAAVERIRTEADVRAEMDKLTEGLSDTDKVALWQYTVAINGPESTSALKKMSMGLSDNREIQLRSRHLYEELKQLRASGVK